MIDSCSNRIKFEVIQAVAVVTTLLPHIHLLTEISRDDALLVQVSDNGSTPGCEV
jgi:hypothetical protein